MASVRKTALVTGSATGVGRACAVRLAKQQFDVVVNYSRSEAEAKETVQLVERLGTSAALIQCDVSSDKDVRTMIAMISRRFGRLDVLVNNAAATQFISHADLESMTEEIWDRIFAVNVKGPFFCARAAADLLRRHGGAIVNVSSVAGISGSGSCIAYCASKGALNTLTKSLARTLAPAIRVNAVCPGPIDTRWLRNVMTDEQIQSLAEGSPIPRPATPEDIADTVMHLATGTVFTTGQIIVVDGGRTI
jgi:3-oxoacyl-[acyl-carrier protein] reductase